MFADYLFLKRLIYVGHYLKGVTNMTKRIKDQMQSRLLMFYLESKRFAFLVDYASALYELLDLFNLLRQLL